MAAAFGTPFDQGPRPACRLSSQRDSSRTTLPPVTAAVRQRLQAVFEHAQRCAEKADYDYAHDLFTQCLVEDPANLIYLAALSWQSGSEIRQQQEGRLASPG